MVISMSWIPQISIQLKTVDLKHGVWYVWQKILRSETSILIHVLVPFQKHQNSLS